MKNIIQQVSEKTNMHLYLFTCWEFALAAPLVDSFNSDVFLAAGFVISAFIDYEE